MDKQTAITVQHMGLESVPGWVSIDKDKQTQIRNGAAQVIEARDQRGFSIIKEMEGLMTIKRASPEGYFSGALGLLYGNGMVIRTVYKKLDQYEEARKNLTDDQLAFLASRGLELMPSASMRFGDFMAAAKMLPAPKKNDEKSLEAWVIDVGEKTKETRNKQRAPMSLDAEMALREAFNALSRILKAAKLKTTTEQRKWLERVIGMVMAERAIPGKLTTMQVQLPAGFKPKRGRPKKKKT